MALSKQDGVKAVVLSGLRATLVMEEGQSLDKEKAEAGLKAAKLELVSIEQGEVTPPDTAYRLAVTGTT